MHWVNPESLPEVTGTLERFTPNPKGEIDGFVLTNNTFVHVPPHLSEAVLALLRPGETVRVRGVRPRGVPDMIAAVAVGAEDGRTIVDKGPPHDDDQNQDCGHNREPVAKGKAPHERGNPGHDHGSSSKRSPMEASGVVRRALHGPRGELRGTLLADGTVIRLGSKDAERFADMLGKAGSPLAVRGDGVVLGDLGRAIKAHEIGLTLAILQPVKGSKHGHGPKHHEPPYG